MALTDRVMDHGRSLAGLPPSSYEATLDFNSLERRRAGSGRDTLRINKRITRTKDAVQALISQKG